MGRASRWLRALFGGKKSPNPKPNPKEKDNRIWGIFVKSFREKNRDDRKRVDDSWRRVDDGEEEQNKRAISVAAATAAVAEAAVMVAQAAAAAVRLTSGRGGGGGKSAEYLAAIKIQAAFRAYLARRALRALKGLVKLQALVRGNIVRKQAAETLRCMQALVRVQVRARACRSLRSDTIQRNSSSPNNPGPSTPEKCEHPNRANAHQPERSSGLRWLDQWMENSDRILEIDTGKPRNYNTVPESPSKDSTIAHSPSSVFDENPQFFSASSSRPTIFTPSKSECSRSVFSGYAGFPSYMSYTESSRAKVRSQSAPKQRPEYEKSGSVRRGLRQQSNLGQRSSLHPFANKGYPGSGRLDRLGVSVKI